ncbi:MAG: 6,7-dimethyl-8-ribityllumazine synthase, partial [Halobacteriales archaeon]|nr:6,7-dimethyl-8-ribityllumazine synthase [Halobacteriales archaeon]
GGPVPRIGLVQCDFNHSITTAMALAAHQEARRLGAPLAHHLHVPGVFDAPLAAKTLLERGDVDAVVVVGCVIQGETGHDEVITHAAAQTLLALACNSGKPVGLGVTGPRMTKAQAEARVSAAAFAVASVVAQHRLLKTV